MRKINDLTGMKFGKLTAIKKVGSNKNKQAFWLCRCDCGNEKIILGSNLLNENTKSCGCYRVDCLIKRTTKHGKSNERIYIIWKLMKGRCNNRSGNNYKYYKERGITYCEEWEEFENFYNWAINNGYSDDLTLDRIDVNGNYCPKNCRWVDRIAQANNTRRNKVIEYNGENRTLAEWSKITGISYSAISGRLKRGWSVEDSLSKKVNDNYWNGRKKTLEIITE